MSEDDVIRIRTSSLTPSMLSEGKLKNFLEWMHSGFGTDLTKFNQYLERNKDEPSLAWQKMSLLQSVIAQPELFGRIKDVSDILMERMDFEKFFKDGSASIANGVWQMCEKSPRPEVAQTGAVIIAEYLRYKVAKDPNFVSDFSGVFKNDFTYGVAITGKMRHAALRDSIVMVQNALVDAVANDKDKYVLNRGIPFLALYKEDAAPNVSRIWTQKLQDVKFASKYDIVKGDMPATATPVFKP